MSRDFHWTPIRVLLCVMYAIACAGMVWCWLG